MTLLFILGLILCLLSPFVWRKGYKSTIDDPAVLLEILGPLMFPVGAFLIWLSFML